MHDGLTVPDSRTITFSAVFNFRDLGGYRTADQRRVVWRRLFRSDNLARLRDDERDAFATLGIRTVVDLRRPHEIIEEGRIPFDDFAYCHVHLVHPIWPPRDFADASERIAYLVERYCELAESAADGIAEALRIIADPDSKPLVFHCIAGKDRTGIVAALTLALLGVSDDDIADDYALSEASELAYWRWRHGDDAQLPVNYPISPREGMLGFLNHLRRAYGSVERYVAAIGVTESEIESMRSHLLVPAYPAPRQMTR